MTHLAIREHLNTASDRGERPDSTDKEWLCLRAFAGEGRDLVGELVGDAVVLYCDTVRWCATRDPVAARNRVRTRFGEADVVGARFGENASILPTVILPLA